MLPNKVTRRRVGALLAGTAALVDALQPAAAAQESQAQAPTDDLAIQRENLNRWRQRVRQVKLPVAVEPAFQFKP